MNIPEVPSFHFYGKSLSQLSNFRILGRWISLLSSGFSSREIRRLSRSRFSAEADLGGSIFSWGAWPAPFSSLFSGLFNDSRKSGDSCRRRWSVRVRIVRIYPGPHFHSVFSRHPCTLHHTARHGIHEFYSRDGRHTQAPAGITSLIISAEKLPVIAGWSYMPKMLNQLHGFLFLRGGYLPSPPL